MPTNSHCRRLLLLLLPLLASHLHAQMKEPATVRISVLSLFHPKTLILRSPHSLTLTLDGKPVILPPNQPATLGSASTSLLTIQVLVNQLPAGTVSSPAASFTLSVPGRITRTYRGALTVTAADGVLLPVLELPTEMAVASIVQAESPPHASLEALKAQAVVSRSFLLANRARHHSADACDTTHCQFLRSPPPSSSPAAMATSLTRNQVLTWRATPESPLQVVPAMYSRSCGGHTRAHATSPSAYPFYSVPCAFCLRHPERWRRTLEPSDLSPSNEQQRLDYNRTHGWSAVRSNTYRTAGAEIAGQGVGHGIGLCQLGAADLAERGRSYQEIVAHFFPDTKLLRLP